MTTTYVFANNVNTTLAAAATNTDTTIQIASSTNLPSLTTGQIMPLTLNDAATGNIYEIVYVTAISGTSLTVIRAQEGTGAQNWSIGDYAFSDNTAGTTSSTLVPNATPGTQSPLPIAQADGRYATGMFNIAVSASSNALTGALADNYTVVFRNTSDSSGTPLTASVSNGLSLTVPSGATLGTVSGQLARLYWALAYSGGTPVMCVCNGFIDETVLQSPTTISTSANSANVLYSATSVTAGSPVRVIGFCDVTETTAGTWATAPSLVQGAGGAALYGMAGLGNGQTWQNVSASRALGTTYYNTTGKPIEVVIRAAVSSGSAGTTVTINGTALPMGFADAGYSEAQMTFTVPDGQSYAVSGPNTLNGWNELR